MLRAKLFFSVMFLCAGFIVSGQTYIDTVPDFHPKTIPSNYFASVANKVSLKKFTPDSALRILFPGKLYKFNYMDERYTLMAWRCPRCPVVSNLNDWSGDNDTFPTRFEVNSANNATDTRIIESLPFKNEQGHNCILFATSSTYLGDILLVGRFNCAWLGLAVFEQINDSWLVTAFNPAVLCSGSFSKTPTPELLTLNGITLACKIESANGPAGGPFDETITVIGLTQQTMHPLFTKALVGRSNSLCRWETTTTLIPDSTQTTPQLKLTTKGQFVREALIEDFDSLAIVTTLPSKITTKPETGFTIVSRYRYNPTGKKPYTLVNQNVYLKPFEKTKY